MALGWSVLVAPPPSGFAPTDGASIGCALAAARGGHSDRRLLVIAHSLGGAAAVACCEPVPRESVEATS